MNAIPLQVKDRAAFEPGRLEDWVQALAKRGYHVIGATVREGAMICDRMTSMEDLPSGWTDEQDDGKHRLKRRSDESLFGYDVDPRSWKRFLHPPIQRLRLPQITVSGFAPPLKPGAIPSPWPASSPSSAAPCTFES